MDSCNLDTLICTRMDFQILGQVWQVDKVSQYLLHCYYGIESVAIEHAHCTDVLRNIESPYMNSQKTIINKENLIHAVGFQPL